MQENKQLKEISDKLDRLIKLLAVNITLGKGQEVQIKLLNNAGFKPKEIADIISTTANTVRVVLTKIRKKFKTR